MTNNIQMSGTDVNEKTFSLPESDGDIVRLFATGWQPREVSFEVIQEDCRIKITGKKNLEVLSKALFKFLVEEREHENDCQ